MVGSTIKVKKKVKRQDEALPKDLLTHTVDFVKANTRFLAFALVAAAVVVAGSFGYKSYRMGRIQAASAMEYSAADLYNQAMAIDLTKDGEPKDSEPAEGEAAKTKPLAERLDERRSLLQQSLTKFEELKKAYPRAKNTEAVLFYIGAVRYELGDYRSAITAFEECLREYSDGEYGAFCMANIARTQEELGEQAAAVQTYEGLFKAHEGAWEIAPYYFNLADLYEKTKQPDSAKDVYMKITSLYPDSRWGRDADKALKRMEGPGKQEVSSTSPIGADMSRLPPGFDPSKVQRVVVGGGKDAKKTISVDKAGAAKKPEAK
ncbi:MAG: tetratricopeptide repeat protein [Candidatus Coatesbacteria bacterium]|nr:tetratricopeptide repeat protein [Candidatus Coatesbacteria bacterium]